MSCTGTDPAPDVVWVVMNKGASSKLGRYAENLVVTHEYAIACTAARMFGFESPMGITKTPGMQSTCQCGDIHVDILCTTLTSSE